MRPDSSSPRPAALRPWLNKSGGKLLSLRDRYRARDGVELFFDKPFALYRPPDVGLRKLGKSIENAVRRVRKGGK